MSVSWSGPLFHINVPFYECAARTQNDQVWWLYENVFHKWSNWNVWSIHDSFRMKSAGIVCENKFHSESIRISNQFYYFSNVKLLPSLFRFIIIRGNYRGIGIPCQEKVATQPTISDLTWVKNVKDGYNWL